MNEKSFELLCFVCVVGLVLGLGIDGLVDLCVMSGRCASCERSRMFGIWLDSQVTASLLSNSSCWNGNRSPFAEKTRCVSKLFLLVAFSEPESFTTPPTSAAPCSRRSSSTGDSTPTKSNPAVG